MTLRAAAAAFDALPKWRGCGAQWAAAAYGPFRALARRGPPRGGFVAPAAQGDDSSPGRVGRRRRGRRYPVRVHRVGRVATRSLYASRGGHGHVCMAHRVSVARAVAAARGLPSLHSFLARGALGWARRWAGAGAAALWQRLVARLCVGRCRSALRGVGGSRSRCWECRTRAAAWQVGMPSFLCLFPLPRGDGMPDLERDAILALASSLLTKADGMPDSERDAIFIVAFSLYQGTDGMPNSEQDADFIPAFPPLKGPKV